MHARGSGEAARRAKRGRQPEKALRFPKAQWGTARNYTRELETSEKRERGMMGTSVERVRGARAGSACGE